MSTILLGGIITGCLYALVAIGLVLIFRTTRAINFAQADIGSVGAFVAVALISGNTPQLRTAGAVAAGIAAAAALAAVIYLVVILPLERSGADKFITMVATVGVSLVIQGILQLKFGYNARTIHLFPSSAEVTVWGVAIPASGIAIVCTAAATFGILALVLYRTRVGLVLRMGGSNLQLTQLSGVSVTRLRVAVWAVAGGIGGWAITLYASYQYIDATVSSGLLLSSAVAASWGAFRSIPWTIIGAIILGILTNVAARYIPVALNQTVSLVVLVGVFFVLQRRYGRVYTRIAIDRAGALVRAFYGRARRYVVAECVLIVVVLLVLFAASDASSISQLDQVMISLIVLLGLSISVRYGGRLNLSAAGFMAIGAYASGVLDGYLPAPASFALTLALCALVGAGLGLVTAGLEEIFYVQISLLITAALPELIVLAKRWTQGNSGLTVPGYLGRTPGANSLGFTLLIVACAIAALVIVACFAYLRSGGRSLLSVADTRVAESIGIRPRRWFVLTEALAALLIGLGGVLTAHDSLFIGASSFGIYVSMLYLMVLIMVGGWSPIGLAIGAAIYVLVPQALSAVDSLPSIIIGLFVIVTVVVSPAGLEGWVARAYRLLARLRPATAQVGAPTAGTDDDRRTVRR